MRRLDLFIKEKNSGKIINEAQHAVSVIVSLRFTKTLTAVR